MKLLNIARSMKMPIWVIFLCQCDMSHFHLCLIIHFIEIYFYVVPFFNFVFFFRGKKDTKASLRLNRDGKEMDFTVIRKPFRLKGTYVRANRFYFRDYYHD